MGFKTLFELLRPLYYRYIPLLILQTSISFTASCSRQTLGEFRVQGSGFGVLGSRSRVVIEVQHTSNARSSVHFLLRCSCGQYRSQRLGLRCDTHLGQMHVTSISAAYFFSWRARVRKSGVCSQPGLKKPRCRLMWQRSTWRQAAYSRSCFFRAMCLVTRNSKTGVSVASVGFTTVPGAQKCKRLLKAWAILPGKARCIRRMLRD